MGRTARQRHRRQSVAHCPSFASDFSKIQSLVEWLKDNEFGCRQKLGVKLSPHTFAGTGRGLQCRSRVRRGDLLVSIPYHLLITRKTVLSDCELPIDGEQTRLNTTDLLSAFLWWHSRRGQLSAWYRYLISLPDSFDELPHFWPNLSLISEWIPKSLSDQFITELNRFEASMKRVFEAIGINSPIDDDIRLFRWSYGAVNTRCVYLDCDDCPQDSALAPFLDLLNHSNEAVVKQMFNKENNCYEIYSLSEYRKYEEVFIRYGNHNNRSLLTNYGFCCFDRKKSDNNSIPVSTEMIFDICGQNYNQNLSKRWTTLIRIGFLSSKETTFWITSESIDWRLETLLRLLSLKHWSEDSVIKRIIYSGNICLSEEETKVYSELRNKLLRFLMSEFKTEKFHLIKNNCLRQLLTEELAILSSLLLQ